MSIATIFTAIAVNAYSVQLSAVLLIFSAGLAFGGIPLSAVPSPRALAGLSAGPVLGGAMASTNGLSEGVVAFAILFLASLAFFRAAKAMKAVDLLVVALVPVALAGLLLYSLGFRRRITNAFYFETSPGLLLSRLDIPVLASPPEVGLLGACLVILGLTLDRPRRHIRQWLLLFLGTSLVVFSGFVAITVFLVALLLARKASSALMIWVAVGFSLLPVWWRSFETFLGAGARFMALDGFGHYDEIASLNGRVPIWEAFREAAQQGGAASFLVGFSDSQNQYFLDRINPIFVDRYQEMANISSHNSLLEVSRGIGVFGALAVALLVGRELRYWSAARPGADFMRPILAMVVAASGTEAFLSPGLRFGWLIVLTSIALRVRTSESARTDPRVRQHAQPWRLRILARRRALRREAM